MKKTRIHKPMILSISAVLALATGLACTTGEKAAQDSTTTAFRYREVYLPEGMGESARKSGLNTLEFDWGLWGHNLAKVLPEDFSSSVYAKINGNTSKKQFCFSSNRLYEYIEEYIDSKFDDNEYARFAILPNDNDIVCLCEKCVIAGNSHGNASPAVNKLVRRLANRFPNHSFFTSDYRTTSVAPTDTMPSNTGVLLSAMSFPLSSVQSPEEYRFIDKINQWTPTTPRVVIWDYINNFDDYFTPFPIFSAMQRRLKIYRDNNATGIFLNGSGADLSSMSDIKTLVLAEMTANPDIDWRTVLQEKATELYPVAGKTIADFMIAQEEMVENSGAVLPLYEGVETALNTYLPEKEFILFHDKLKQLLPSTEGAEKEALQNLIAELSLTRLEINRINGTPENSNELIADLQSLIAKNVKAYNESGWTLESYINDYNFLLKDYKDTNKKNKLKGARLIPLTALDPQYTDVTILTDRVLGIPSNYHSGLLITSPESFTQIAVPNKPGTKKIKVWMAYNPAYRIFLPEYVSLTTADGKKLGSAAPKYPENDSGHASVEFDVPSNATGTFTLTFHKNPETHSLAIEEIQAF
ncbi:MAG: DUF4838 domain-containing protein [Muribaculaceae bacterium]|nr:DUF4838 domain-containing protein [Muribaculaceae bacterium]